MIQIQEIKEITEIIKQDIAEELIEVIDERLKTDAVLLNDEEIVSLDIGILLNNNFNMGDKNQILYNYNKMMKSRMDIAVDLAKQYRRLGWNVEIVDKSEEGQNQQPALIFSIENTI